MVYVEISPEDCRYVFLFFISINDHSVKWATSIDLVSQAEYVTKGILCSGEYDVNLHSFTNTETEVETINILI